MKLEDIRALIDAATPIRRLSFTTWYMRPEQVKLYNAAHRYMPALLEIAETAKSVVSSFENTEESYELATLASLIQDLEAAK